jgi:hypothetical protein
MKHLQTMEIIIFTSTEKASNTTGFLPIRKLLTLLSEQGRLSRLLNVADF